MGSRFGAAIGVGTHMKSIEEAGSGRSPATGEACLRLPADCGIAAAGTLQADLLAASDAGSPTSVDASAVERCGTAAVQVLLAAMRDGAARGRPVRISAPSAAVREAVSALGLAESFHLQEV